MDPVLSNPTRTSRLKSEDKFEKLSQKIDTKINEGLTTMLTQFELRLEAALDSIRQTVTTSLSARSQVVTELESETEYGHRSNNASRKTIKTANNDNQDNELDLDPLDVRPNNRVAEPVQFGSEAFLTQQVAANSHIVTGVGYSHLSSGSCGATNFT